MTPQQLLNAGRLILGAAGAVIAILLVQTDVPLDPVVKLVLVCANAAIAALSPVAVAAKLPNRSGGGG